MSESKKQIIKDCRNGVNHTVCFDCGAKYSEKPAYEYAMTVYQGTCDICHETTTVGPARKIFGHYKSV